MAKNIEIRLALKTILAPGDSLDLGVNPEACACKRVKSTQDGRKVEVIDGWVCLSGVREANSLVPLDEHPNRQAISRALHGATHMAGRIPLTHAEAAIAQSALSAAKRIFDASPSGITQRLRQAVWAKAAAEGVD